MVAARSKEVVVRLPLDLHEQVRLRSLAEERSMAGTIRIALRAYFAKPSPESIARSTRDAAETMAADT